MWPVTKCPPNSPFARSGRSRFTSEPGRANWRFVRVATFPGANQIEPIWICRAAGHFHRRQATAIDRQAVADFQAATGDAGAHGHFNGFRRRRIRSTMPASSTMPVNISTNLTVGRDAVEPCLMEGTQTVGRRACDSAEIVGNPRSTNVATTPPAPSAANPGRAVSIRPREVAVLPSRFRAFAGDRFARIASAQNFRRIKKRDAVREAAEQKRGVHLAAAFHQQAGDVFRAELLQ